MKKATKLMLNKPVRLNPVLDGLALNLKDPKCFKRIEDKLRGIMKSDHTHKSVKEFIRCKECVDKRKKRQDMMKELGFKSINQFLEWRKIHQIIAAKKNFQIR